MWGGQLWRIVGGMKWGQLEGRRSGSWWQQHTPRSYAPFPVPACPRGSSNICQVCSWHKSGEIHWPPGGPQISKIYFYLPLMSHCSPFASIIACHMGSVGSTAYYGLEGDRIGLWDLLHSIIGFLLLTHQSLIINHLSVKLALTTEPTEVHTEMLQNAMFLAEAKQWRHDCTVKSQGTQKETDHIWYYRNIEVHITREHRVIDI